MAIDSLGITITNAREINAIRLPKDVGGVVVQHIWDGTGNPIRNLWIFRSWIVDGFGEINEASLLYKVVRGGSGFIPLAPVPQMDYQSSAIYLKFLHKRPYYANDDYPYLVQVWYPN